MKRLGLHRVDGRSYWFAGYFNTFDRDLMVRYAGAARAERFRETFAGAVPFPDARIVKVYDPVAARAQEFSATFRVPVATTLEEFADGLDGVIVPFPAGGDARDYAAVAPLAARGLPLFLDRLILEQAEVLRKLCGQCAAQCVPLHVTAFTRYAAELLRPPPEAEVTSVIAGGGGEPAGYGADLLDLVDELMPGRVVSVLNAGSAAADVLRLRYADDRHAVVQLFHATKVPLCVTAQGPGWSRSLELDGSQNHRCAWRQFQAFLTSLETREPPVAYARVLQNAAILNLATRGAYGKEFMLPQV